MRIAVVSNFTRGQTNGAAIFSDTLADSLSKNHHVLYICLGDRLETRRRGLLQELTIPYLDRKGDDVPLNTRNTNNYISRNLSIFAPDVIQINTHLFNGLIAINWAIRNCCPVLYTLHHVPTIAVRHSFPGLSPIFARLLQRAYLLHLRVVLGHLSAHALNNMMVLTINKINPKVEVYKQNTFVNLKVFSLIKPKTPLKIKKFVYLGTYGKRKNQIFLANTFKYLPDNYHLELYGDDHDRKYVKILREIVDDNNLKVKINRSVDHNKVPEILSSADYFLSASLNEAQSLAIVESLASYTPVFGLSNQTVDELINKSNGLRISRDTDEKQFAKQIFKFTSIDSREYHNLAIAAHKSSARFDIQLVTENLVNIFGKCTIVRNDSTVERMYLSFLIYPTLVIAYAAEVTRLLQQK